MLILYAGMKYDYGKREQGYSFEHYNFYDSLRNMGHDILYFDFMTLMQDHSKEWMNRRLREIAKTEKPQLMFTALFTDELEPSVLREISENTETTTLNWFCDDHWRFDNYSRYWAPCFNWVVTTAKSALPKYQRFGIRNVIKSQWAANHFLYRKLDLPVKYDVTFVGQPHGNRREIIDALRNAGHSVNVWGSGWESGRLSQTDMIEVFNESRINLNLSNASAPIPSSHSYNKIRGFAGEACDVIPFGSKIKAMGKWGLSQLSKVKPGTEDPSQDGHGVKQYAEQIKGRNFEVPGCGGFMLTGRADNLEDYYEVGKEVVCFDDSNDLVDKVAYYLTHDEERIAVAQAGYQRTLRQHTYVHRFSEIFQRLGLPHKSPREVFNGEIPLGRTVT
jgi:spore maturation protein CgeB